MQPAPAAARSSESQGKLPESEASSYKREMDSLAEMANLKRAAGKQMGSIGALDRATELLNEASQMIRIASCLNNQMGLGVPFYQGKATCSVAEGGQR